MTEDLRKDRRTQVVGLVVRYKSADLDQFIEEHSHDISRGGVFLKSSEPCVAGTLLRLELRLAATGETISGVGRVVWSREPDEATQFNPSGMGVKFFKFDNPDSEALLARIVRAREQDGISSDVVHERLGLGGQNFSATSESKVTDHAQKVQWARSFDSLSPNLKETLTPLKETLNPLKPLSLQNRSEKLTEGVLSSASESEGRKIRMPTMIGVALPSVPPEVGNASRAQVMNTLSQLSPSTPASAVAEAMLSSITRAARSQSAEQTDGSPFPPSPHVSDPSSPFAASSFEDKNKEAFIPSLSKPNKAENDHELAPVTVRPAPLSSSSSISVAPPRSGFSSPKVTFIGVAPSALSSDDLVSFKDFGGSEVLGLRPGQPETQGHFARISQLPPSEESFGSGDKFDESDLEFVREAEELLDQVLNDGSGSNVAGTVGGLTSSEAGVARESTNVGGVKQILANAAGSEDEKLPLLSSSDTPIFSGFVETSNPRTSVSRSQGSMPSHTELVDDAKKLRTASSPDRREVIGDDDDTIVSPIQAAFDESQLNELLRESPPKVAVSIPSLKQEPSHRDVYEVAVKNPEIGARLVWLVFALLVAAGAFIIYHSDRSEHHGSRSQNLEMGSAKQTSGSLSTISTVGGEPVGPLRSRLNVLAGSPSSASTVGIASSLPAFGLTNSEKPLKNVNLPPAVQKLNKVTEMSSDGLRRDAAAITRQSPTPAVSGDRSEGQEHELPASATVSPSSTAPPTSDSAVSSEVSAPSSSSSSPVLPR